MSASAVGSRSAIGQASGDPYSSPQDFSELRSTTYHRVHQALLADIINGTFAPGARLKIAQLCARYGLSAMPIREALQQLQGEGIVVMSPNKGASVRPIDRDFITDIHDVRGALYPIIYRDAIATADHTFDQALLEIQARFDAMMQRGDVQGCRDENHALHAAVEARCRNREVGALIRKYANLTQSLRDVFGFEMKRLQQISREHWAIIDAVRARDPARAATAAQHHSAQALVNMLRHFDHNVEGGVRKPQR
ncbi:MAG: GntR family transcriptional regulator [Acidisphaera sp.]|nr:GntR family transcriptional regulator [Acidisphaera sp.]